LKPVAAWARPFDDPITDGTVTFAKSANARDYGVVDEIASRVIRSGGRILGVRKADIPGGKSLAAILRHAM
jgi:hypothetical protein